MSEAAAGTLWLVGCGNMGGAMLRRWIGAGRDPASVTVIDPGKPQLPGGVALRDSPPVGSPDLLVLAVKPQQLDLVAPGLADARPGLLVSILAGVELSALRDQFEARSIVRAMPNLPVAIGKGVIALHGEVPAAARDAAEALMTPLGHVEWIADETLFDAVTALSGSGPGFTFRYIDALAKAGTALGLPADQAARLAIATVEGTALMAAASDVSPATLAERVASPRGSTREGLNVLDRDGVLDRLLLATLRAAEARNAAMAAEARK